MSKEVNPEDISAEILNTLRSIRYFLMLIAVMMFGEAIGNILFAWI